MHYMEAKTQPAFYESDLPAAAATTFSFPSSEFYFSYLLPDLQMQLILLLIVIFADKRVQRGRENEASKVRV